MMKQNYLLKTFERNMMRVSLFLQAVHLKLCYIAEGKADIYTRIGPTMEWDIVAAHAIDNGAGKVVVIYYSGDELFYNKEDCLNDYFVITS